MVNIEEILRDKKLRVTKKRILILEIIIANEEPVSAEEIFDICKKKNKNLDLSTIYRNLNTMADENLLLKNTNSDGISYFQLNDINHKHFITCISCNRRFILDNCPIHNIEDEIESETGFLIKGHNFEFTGICPDCQKKLKKN
ncbi:MULTISPECIES: Fur family transcriptional regulator [Anaerococcus]|uniref:Fur family transcriptional regulator n=1 Tax=Anaerococcus TaxID=165779 RepID=UPI0012B1A527|nr:MULTISPECIES: Fur family transcriptional regulator [Anaerococcus]MDY3006428.1 Fur family transcriptional regulator [Anaerococcus porci]